MLNLENIKIRPLTKKQIKKQLSFNITLKFFEDYK